MNRSSYPYVKTPPIFRCLIKKQQQATEELTYKPRRRRRRKVNNSDFYWWGFPIGTGGYVIIRFLLTIDWDFGSFIIFMGAVAIALISGYLLIRSYYRDFKSEPPPEYIVNKEIRKKAIDAKNKIRKRYLSRPLKDKVKKLLKGKVRTLEPLTPSATVGVSEKQFLAVLQKYFGQRVNFPNGVFSIIGTTFEYTPDIVYQDSYTGLTIDIEIDEPYAGKSKEPHHCNDNDKDRNRDDFFLKRNWVVVRFAEEQVVKYPVACAYYLSKVIYQLSGIRYEVPAEKLPSIPTWDSEESTSMARLLHRETYLKEHGLWQIRIS
ncbi:hypothetical protein A5482_014715 (plasmid) [Cyanobacterium sp. IPPAS B-1200]|uniref:hypothetical protein n=1 Tax=Cyanobacterium sp. IPPAS B-1200 TaxID=1562720 RepID=UPI0008524C25|nr:hypothetical protein [Cyanobacterium sp. IPPAS B-1200]OEJ78146.1 hypothetical protein A5482_14005 [Cyanobacterium sp. IPPAS B-1200]